MPGIKIAVSGKGGVGKTTVVAAWARLLANRGSNVLAVDADPDANLAAALGFPAGKRRLVKTLSEEKSLIEARTGAVPGRMGQLFSLTPEVSDIASSYAVTHDHVSLLVLGAVKKGGGGCACPESVFLKNLVRHLIVHDNEAVILDMEAGVEHLGRGTAAGVDALVVVTESGRRSLDTATRIRALSDDLGLGDKTSILLNKAVDPGAEREAARAMFPGVPILGIIPRDERFVEADRKGVSFLDLDGAGELIRSFEKALNELLARIGKAVVSVTPGNA